jgi:DNA mismatch repair protein MutL
MSRIHALPEDLVARIAAGEVVERPASILKELVENSLDAGATHIAVSIEGAGRNLIRISDNGCGMTKDDATMALKRHATSKISSFDDLESLHTFGFRGEALPSIAAVSRLTLTTRCEEDEAGWKVEIEGGKITGELPVPREVGTTIEVRDIFFNTPARFKFLKSDGTERAQCLRVMEEMIFSIPAVTFELQVEKAKPTVFRGFVESDRPEAHTEALKTRLIEAWGSRWARSFLSVYKETPHFRAMGVVTNQGGHQATSRYQFLYVNKRPVTNRRLARAIYDAYQGQLPSLRHPGWALFVDLNPSTIDVNVHPSKREVKLTHESELYAFLNSAVKDALRGTPPAMSRSAVSAPLGTTQTAREPGSPYKASPAPTSIASPAGWSRPESTAFENAPLAEPRTSPARETTPAFPEFAVAETRPELADLRDPELVVVAQLRKTYIVAQTQQGLILVDQHAAAEQAAYERLLFNLKAEKRAVQMLLVPFTWEVAMSLKPHVESNLERLTRMGFVIEAFGGNTFIVKAVPANLSEGLDLHSLLDGLSDELSSNHRAADLDHRVAAMAACKASVKAGDPLTNAASQQIIRQLALCASPFTCPHGRPTVVRFPYSELDRRFRRA